MGTPSRLLRWATGGTAVVLMGGLVLGAQAPATPPPSAALAKEVAALMAAKQLGAFASRDSLQAGRFVGAMHVPGVQLLTVSAAYSKPDDIEYSLYNKLYQNAYLDLNSGALSTDKFWVDDAQADGLVAVPGKKAVQFDSVAVAGVRQVFDGDFVPAGRRNAKKLSHDVYMKNFEDAESRYAKVLEALLVALKKLSEPLAGPGVLR